MLFFEDRPHAASYPSSALVLTGLLTLEPDSSLRRANPYKVPGLFSARIDELIGLRLAKEKIPPAPPADDAEFFRRLSLDLNGRIPSLTQLVDFLDDTRTDKRRLWVDELLDGPDNASLYVQHFAHFWRRQLARHPPRSRTAVVTLPSKAGYAQQLTDNTPYDQLVRRNF